MISSNKLYDPILNKKNKEKTEYVNFVESYLANPQNYDDSKLKKRKNSLFPSRRDSVKKKSSTSVLENFEDKILPLVMNSKYFIYLIIK